MKQLGGGLYDELEEGKIGDAVGRMGAALSSARNKVPPGAVRLKGAVRAKWDQGLRSGVVAARTKGGGLRGGVSWGGGRAGVNASSDKAGLRARYSPQGVDFRTKKVDTEDILDRAYEFLEAADTFR